MLADFPARDAATAFDSLKTSIVKALFLHMVQEKKAIRHAAKGQPNAGRVVAQALAAHLRPPPARKPSLFVEPS